MKAKKIIALILVAIFSLGIVAACGPDDPPPPPPPEPGGEVADPAPDIPTPDDLDQLPEAQVRVFENHVTITYSCPQVRLGMDYNTDCDYARWLFDKFNFTFEPTHVPWGEWINLHAMWIMSQDMPDVIVFNYMDTTHADAANFVDQGLIRRLPDDWKSRWPNLAMVFHSTNLGPRLEQEFGGTYFLPRARFFFSLGEIMSNPLQDHWALRFRRDWFEAMGVEVRSTYTIPEVLDIARLIRDKDPGNMGENLVPLALRYGNAGHFFLFKNSTWWNSYFIDDDGYYQWGPFCPSFEEGLMYWFTAWDEGLLSPEFFLLDHGQDLDLFRVTGRAGIFFGGAPTHDIMRAFQDFEANLGIDSWEAMGFATLLGANGLYHQRDLINFWGAVAFSPTADQEVVERWLYLMDFTASRDGYPATQMGIPGVDWKWDDDGNLVSLVPFGTLLEGTPGSGAKYPSLGHVLGSSILFDDLAFINPNIGQRYRDLGIQLYRDRFENSTRESFPYANWDLWMFDSPEFRRAGGISISQEMTNLIVNASSMNDLLASFHQWRENQMGIVQPALDQLNAQLR